jgi:hypothetical protein
VIAFACKNSFRALSLACFAAANFLLRCVAPRAALQGLHDGTRPSLCVPSRSTSTRWSASVAGLRRHQWQIGLSASRALRACWYPGDLYSLRFIVAPPHPAAPPEGGLLTRVHGRALCRVQVCGSCLFSTLVICVRAERCNAHPAACLYPRPTS